MNNNEIVVDGMVYVKKDQDSLSRYSIVRTYSAGVFCGEITKREGQEVHMKNARRLWYWDGAATLSQLSIDGVSKPENCKFPAEVDVILLQAIEILPCSVKSMKSINEVPIWQE